MAPDAETHRTVEDQVAHLLEGLAPCDSGYRYLNLTESRVDPRTIFPAASYERLQALKTRYDPTSIFQANHAIPPAGG